MRRELPEREPGLEQEPVTDHAPAPAPATEVAGRASAGSPAGVLALQRTAGNAAVSAMILRNGGPAGPAAPPDGQAIADLRKLLDDDDERGAIAKMGQLSPTDAGTVLADPRLRALAVDAFNDNEMAQAMRALRGGTLTAKLRWMFAEGTSWSLVRPMLADPATDAAEKTALYPHNDLRSGFTSICDDDEMAEAVRLIGGALEQKLNWMFVEGTSWKAVESLISDRTVPAEQKSAVLGKTYLRDFFVDLCNDNEMLLAVRYLWGTLEQRVRWLFAEGTSWPLMRVLLNDPRVDATERTALYAHNDLRSEFTGICDDDEMAEAVKMLGGTLAQKLNWMFVEGTSWKAVKPLISDPTVPADQKLRLYDLDYMRGFFVDICNNNEMAEAVITLGGTFAQRKPWLDDEGTTTDEYLNALVRLRVRETGTVAHSTARQADQMIRSSLGEIVASAAGKASRRIEGQVAVVGDDDWDVAGLNTFGSTWATERNAINGFVDDDGRVWIHKDRGNPATMVHEGCHKWSADDMRTKLSWELNEGTTEYFTRKVAAAQTPNLAPGRSNYQPNWTLLNSLVAFVGERTVASAYFDGATGALKNAYKAARGGPNADADWTQFLADTDAKSWAAATALLTAAPAAAPAGAGGAGGGAGGGGGGGAGHEEHTPGPAGAAETPACR